MNRSFVPLLSSTSCEVGFFKILYLGIEQAEDDVCVLQVFQLEWSRVFTSAYVPLLITGSALLKKYAYGNLK